MWFLFFFLLDFLVLVSMKFCFWYIWDDENLVLILVLCVMFNIMVVDILLLRVFKKVCLSEMLMLILLFVFDKMFILVKFLFSYWKIGFDRFLLFVLCKISVLLVWLFVNDDSVKVYCFVLVNVFWWVFLLVLGMSVVFKFWVDLYVYNVKVVSKSSWNFNGIFIFIDNKF